MSHSKKILFIFTGSIAVYKAVTLVSRLVQRGYDVECVLTPSALRFIGRATIEGLIGKSIHTDLYDSENVMSHIHLIRDAEAVIVAPTTANFINKMASGIADDLASTLFLAHDFKKPFIVAPAMNTKMYEHPQTQNSLRKLKEIGVTILEAGSGILACGDVGYGKLLDPEIMIVEIEKAISTNTSDSSHVPVSQIKWPRILITGGGTVEKIDDVRSITNTSTGATSIALAEYFFNLGLPTTLLINNQKNVPIPVGIKCLSYSSFEELNSQLKKELASETYDVIIHAAAVSDFSISNITGTKNKNKISSNRNIKITLKPNFKIIAKLHRYSKNKRVKIIGFKLTSHASPKEVAIAVAKLFANKNVVSVVHNDMTGIDAKKGTHRFSFFKNIDETPIPIESRDQLVSYLAQLVSQEAL